jgi:hypothetical protein
MFAYHLDLALRILKRSPKLTALMVAAIGVGVAASASAASRAAAGQAQGSNAQNVTPSAYECIAGSKVWIQMAPCPRIYLKDPRNAVDDDDSTTESDLTRGSAVPLERVPVQQQPLDASALCRALHDHKVPLKHHGSSDVYERNLAKSKYCQ